MTASGVDCGHPMLREEDIDRAAEARGNVYSFRLCDYPQLDSRLTFDFDGFVDSISLR